MGLVLGFIFIPCFFILFLFSFWLALRLKRYTNGRINYKKRIFLNFFGFLIAILATFFATSLVPEDNIGWTHLIFSISAAILGPFVVGLILLAGGFLLSTFRPLLLSIAAGAFLASFPTPFIVSLSFVQIQTLQSQNAFEPLCKKAYVEYLSQTTDVKSVALIPDQFFDASKRNTIPMSEYILNNSNIEFIERPATDESSLKGVAVYERVRIEEPAIGREHKSHARAKYIYEPINQITSEYIVKPESLSIQLDPKLEIGGSQISILRREDNRVISRTRYFWSAILHQTCPSEAKSPKFIDNFIFSSLGIEKQ